MATRASLHNSIGQHTVSHNTNSGGGNSSLAAKSAEGRTVSSKLAPRSQKTSATNNRSVVRRTTSRRSQDCDVKNSDDVVQVHQVKSEAQSPEKQVCCDFLNVWFQCCLSSFYSVRR